MSGVNKVILVGRLGKDPEMRYLDNGDAVCNFSLATGEKWTDKQTGEKKESTEWHRITVWRKQAEACGQYLAKGKQAYVEGKLKTRKWQDRDGNDRWTTEVQANSVVFLGSKGDGSGGDRPPPETEEDAPPLGNDDVPF